MKQFLKRLDKALLPCMGGALVLIVGFQFFGGSVALGWFSSVLQVITVALAVSAWITAKSLLHEHELTVNNAKKDSESVILIFEIDKDIVGQVSTYAKKQNIIDENLNMSVTPLGSVSEGFNVEVSERIITIYNKNRMPNNQLGAEDYLRDFQNAFSKATEYLRNRGVTTLHLFCSCPVVFSYYIGSELKNNFSVVPYHFANNASGEDIYFPV